MVMANYRPKGPEYMRELARRGARRSAETRQRKSVEDILVGQYEKEQGIDLESGLLGVPAARLQNRSGGSHDTDWRCPYPENGRLTRAALRTRAAEHRTEAILKKYGL